VVAGLTAGQDISDREVQLTGSPPQFLPGRAFGAYGPTGPAVVSIDSFENPGDIALRCEVWGEVVQESLDGAAHLRGAKARLVPLLHLHALAGDLIFTGTPDGWAWGVAVSSPPETRSSHRRGVGELRNRCIGAQRGTH